MLMEPLQPIAVLSVDFNKACLYQPRPRHPKRLPEVLPPIEQGWRQGKFFFDHPLVVKTRVPLNTAPSLGALQSFLDRVDAINEDARRLAEIDAIAKSADKDLATVQEELRNKGIKVVSYDDDTKGDDDELHDPQRMVQHTPDEPLPEWNDPELVAAIMDRIEWERATLQNSLPVRYGILLKDGVQAGFARLEGKTGFIPAYPNKALDAVLPDLKDDFKAMLQGDDEPLFARRARVEYYEHVGSFIYGVREATEPAPDEGHDKDWDFSEALPACINDCAPDVICDHALREVGWTDIGTHILDDIDQVVVARHEDYPILTRAQRAALEEGNLDAYGS